MGKHTVNALTLYTPHTRVYKHTRRQTHTHMISVHPHNNREAGSVLTDGETEASSDKQPDGHIGAEPEV